ncbi:tRNA preQ1(34) S-adenosylmethionine ribosyltransferase-isomerase QueA [Acidiphilium iwatense]|uniref:S-adenosylmethionine:tRNA ribosyltransferase-isomerase n=1 Tax=Acidiphilium iwatense TaxID=768198 RepID=A0ABS9DZB7_9PROT|nr:tRNA preQ1(34) S-adenosylmethionine ribosyltransferase-isomerase QueA [Acidiphilium iwatense]MCF3947021.1 tRNA preQ1(34) S-adenosylmethionine ribosyltransferase-isomerase QueA [Acidiphilium iwatense]
MNLADFDYDLPPERIAAEPARPRDAARLLHVARDGLHDRQICDLPSLLRSGDCLVVNDTRVIPAQLQGRRGDARIGITLDRPLADGSWRVLLRNARRARVGETIAIDGADGFSAMVIARSGDGSAVLRFDRDGEAFRAALEQAGALALPPYIPRAHGATARDSTDYQTMFAAREGAVAAPTAGLHFTSALQDALTERGIGLTRVTLHVGAGTFLPVRGEIVTDHRMHAERGEISEAAARTINRARENGGRIVAVGTTSLRVLETASDAAGVIHPWAGETELFILPGYRFRAVDVLLTNFHLPRSTLLMLVAAFAGLECIRTAYAHAIGAGYRFYSYGDACLLEKP